MAKTRYILIEQHEGRKYVPYKDIVGKWTVGVGRNMDDVEFSDDEVELMFHNDVQKAFDAAWKYDWFQKLNTARSAAITDMIFQLGPTGFSKFKKTIKLMEKEEHLKAAAEMMDSKWARQTPMRATEIALIIQTGHWPDWMV